MVGMSLESWNGASLSSALVDSALAGSHGEASLSWTSVSFWAKAPAIMKMRIHATATGHFVTRLVSFPAIGRCMGRPHQKEGTVGIGFPPEVLRSRLRQPAELIDDGASPKVIRFGSG